jgi:hypothetical protein
MGRAAASRAVDEKAPLVKAGLLFLLILILNHNNEIKSACMQSLLEA